jgi:AcrR family transcriptional regulator
MPRAFTDEERGLIRRRLQTAARAAVGRVGIRRTNVAELAAAAGISKGAFYKLYPSKEALLLEVFAEVEGEVRAELRRRLDVPWGSARVLVERFLRFQFEILDRHPVLRVLTDPEETAVLFRAVPPEVLAERLADDDRFFLELFQQWRARGWIREVDLEALAGLPRLALVLAQQRELVGAERFPALVELMVEGLSARIARPGARDPRWQEQ